MVKTNLLYMCTTSTSTKWNQQPIDSHWHWCNCAIEDLQIAAAWMGQLWNECTNSKQRRSGRYVEKCLWSINLPDVLIQSVQDHLVDENKTLALEWSYLSDLVVNVQKVHYDLEHSGENDYKRLENQLQMLETPNVGISCFLSYTGLIPFGPFQARSLNLAVPRMR